MTTIEQIRPGITRISAAPDAANPDHGLIVDPAMRRGAAVAQPPLPLTVTFTPRPVERLETDGPPQIRVYQTVDGQRTEIVNLL